ncbi:uncharacterized protein LOC121875075 [Homarus americanus]|uniref:uncharacterized protein LOC121875075 n=1 Tax=Homarus americanus TaxID=6706 RepID=UPI001C44DBE5|nr:uncharacterized protein LOC121875075 [Homarus americanus]
MAEEEHVNKLEVLKRMVNAGVKLKRSKCVYQALGVTYLGHKINAEGLNPSDENVLVIMDAPIPYNVTELKSYLGLINFYGKFIPNLSKVLSPLYRLLQKDVKWQWGPSQQQALAESKRGSQGGRSVFDGAPGQIPSYCERPKMWTERDPTLSKAPLHPWERPQQPWSMIHLDYAGPFMGKMFLVIIDAHSKRMYLHPTNFATSYSAIEELKNTFASQGLPDTVMTDIGTNFCSMEFEEFMKQIGIAHIKTSPYHPASNSLA